MPPLAWTRKGRPQPIPLMPPRMSGNEPGRPFYVTAHHLWMTQFGMARSLQLGCLQFLLGFARLGYVCFIDLVTIFPLSRHFQVKDIHRAILRLGGPV